MSQSYACERYPVLQYSYPHLISQSISIFTSRISMDLGVRWFDTCLKTILNRSACEVRPFFCILTPNGREENIVNFSPTTIDVVKYLNVEPMSELVVDP